ncbi:hypothetical protein BJ875DRAFT_488278 [Amylocarpus encephaloides]|uniref:Uncharacterized protein n=1 Tax=Amylocarpus encephaloides TaxID=45428 RepID=A0A9P7YA12_9HELO|nr:hypothetical protein BJ875DRAFT_488278 [Amylocarpus encephaloides]
MVARNYATVNLRLAPTSEPNLYIFGPLIRDYDLDITVKEKPILSIDDLLLLLNHHWARDTSTFPTERHRV